MLFLIITNASKRQTMQSHFSCNPATLLGQDSAYTEIVISF